jgi:uncharacterized protein with PIN domain
MPMTALRTEPARVELEGRHIKCLMCAGEQFHKRRSHVDTSVSAGMKPEWHESQATCLVCDHCGFLHWFIQR